MNSRRDLGMAAGRSPRASQLQISDSVRQNDGTANKAVQLPTFAADERGWLVLMRAELERHQREASTKAGQHPQRWGQSIFLLAPKIARL